MYNPESILRNTIRSAFVTFIIVFGVSGIKPFYKDTGINTKVASLCVEKMQQGLRVSNLPVASQKMLIVQGVDCLKSAPNIDVKKNKYQVLFSTADAIIGQTELEKQALEILLINMNHLQADLASMSKYQGVNMVMDYLLHICKIMLFLVICTLIFLLKKYDISSSWSVTRKGVNITQTQV